MPRSAALTLRSVQLLVGLFLYGAATALMVRAVVGVSSWTVLTQGLENVVPWSFGTITVVSSGVVLLAWIPLRQKPGIGTLVNALTVGPASDLVLGLVRTPDGLLPRIGLFVGGLALLAVATACYIGARFGSGPRDGLMVGLHERFGWPLWVARTSVEVVVVAVGWLLGGDVGLGTVVAAVAIGPMVQPLMPLFARFPWSPERDGAGADSAPAAVGLEARPASAPLVAPDR
jgi:uncharacterized membrane protein YczE